MTSKEERMSPKPGFRLAAVAVASFLCLGMLSGVATAQDEEEEFTTDFRLEDCRFEAKGRNPYFPLKPGHQLVLEGEDDGETIRVEITVLHETERIFVPGIGWVRTRVVQEREWVDDELVEISRNFFATCRKTNDVAYFGEEVDIFNEDGSVTHEGQWLAGQPDGNGLAEPGLIMPGTFLLGARYFQEIADGIALDRAEHVEMGLEVTTEAGKFFDCVRVIETSPLEPGSESEKLYCPGVGLVADNEAHLVEINRVGPHDADGEEDDEGDD
jgi:hypothetical protein